MAFTDNFGHPKGLEGRLMLVMMEKSTTRWLDGPWNSWNFPRQAR